MDKNPHEMIHQGNLNLQATKSILLDGFTFNLHNYSKLLVRILHWQKHMYIYIYILGDNVVVGEVKNIEINVGIHIAFIQQ